ncbi:dubious [Schizosaccharomyces pombe]|uniref:Uncharacterized protein SPAPB1A11.06 n=1 Tax=Schizosaccharomyces pombe (strain 972 / ATCC 24843) TaxID=284812 RepID=YKN6_SCHPO|nr:RecName: Full=Uncharacterized protein SPAPB1A11.06 [Schizosaccharomyces pombe 972h-]
MTTGKPQSFEKMRTPFPGRSKAKGPQSDIIPSAPPNTPVTEH